MTTATQHISFPRVPHPYLLACLQQWPPSQNLPGLEEKVRSLLARSGGRLTLEICQAIQDRERIYWSFEDYWYFPSYKKIEQACGALEGPLTFVLSETRWISTAKKLLRVFKWIESVSVILRFLKPDRFGIISPPVESVLWIQRHHDPLDTYIAYVGNLGALKVNAGLSRAADVEMALWVHFQRLMKKDPGAAAFEKNTDLGRVRLSNVASVLFSKYSLEEIGETMADLGQRAGQQDIVRTRRMAGLILGLRFEELVLTIARKNGWSEKKLGDNASRLFAAIEHLGRTGLGSYREIRNKCMHDSRGPSARDLYNLKNMIRVLQDDAAR